MLIGALVKMTPDEHWVLLESRYGQETVLCGCGLSYDHDEEGLAVNLVQ